MVDLVVHSRDEVPEDRGDKTVRVYGRKQAESKVEVEQLLPGIPNEITIHHIASKLPWRAFDALSSVCRGWQRAIGSHQVHEARVSSKSTQTFLAYDQWTSSRRTPVRQSFTKGSTIVLCCIEDRACYYLPQNPRVNGGIPVASKCISLNGALYVLGGLKDYTARADVYVFDLAGQRHWKECASMKDARINFGCGAKDGKIYVFGGQSYPAVQGHICGSEVYDPKEDVWSPITTIPSFRINFEVTTLGEEFFLHGGLFYNPERIHNGVASRVLDLDNLQDALFAEIYHPHKDEWRIVENFTRCSQDIVLMVGGKFHRLNQAGLQVYDSLANSWGPPHPILFNKPEQIRSITDVISAVVVKDEVLAMVYRTMSDEKDECDEIHEDDPEGVRLILSYGVGGKETEIVWKILPLILSVNFICPIQL